MDEPPSNPVPHSIMPATMSWLALCFVATTASSLYAAHAPHRIRLIGLFSIAFGLLIGWLVVRLAEMIEFQPWPRVAGGVAATMTFCGLVGGMWETWRLEESRQNQAAKDRIAERLIEHLKEQPEASETIHIDTSALSDFRWYLSHRVRQLGHWSTPWPELLWGLELVIATIASFTIALRIQSTRSNQKILTPTNSEA